jgi:hypothetical protein
MANTVSVPAGEARGSKLLHEMAWSSRPVIPLTSAMTLMGSIAMDTPAGDRAHAILSYST